MSDRLPTVSAAQRRALLDAGPSGVVLATLRTVRALVRAGLADEPAYNRGAGRSTAVLTDLGHQVRAKHQPEETEK